jgi:hypothetical protein
VPSPIAPPLAALALAIAVAGCGSATPTTSSSGAAAPSQKAIVTDAFRFSRCMRTHGLPHFPDPKVSVAPGKASVGIAVNPSETKGPQFKAAQHACQGIMPGAQNVSPAQQAQQDHAHEQVLLAFARCLRTHGVPRFPDPTSQGQLTPQMLSSAGVDVNQPGFLVAGRACVGVTHGAITAAQVAQAVKHLQ